MTIPSSPQDHGTALMAEPAWRLRLYIAGKTARAEAALSNLQHLCGEHLAGHYNIEVIDLLQTPALAAGDQILAVPTVVRQVPEPMRRIIGDLSDKERVLVGLDIQPMATALGN